MAPLNNKTVLQTQTYIKNIQSTPLIPSEKQLFVQLEELNNSNGYSGAAYRFDLGGESRALIPKSVSTC